MPTRPIDEDARLRAKETPGTANIDTSAPKEPAELEHLGTPGSYDGFGAAHKDSDSDSQPPVEPPSEDAPDEAFRDPVKEGI